MIMDCFLQLLVDYYFNTFLVLFLLRSEEPSESDILRPQSQRRQIRHAHSEVILPSEMQRKMSLASVKEKGYARLEEELSKAQKVESIVLQLILSFFSVT